MPKKITKKIPVEKLSEKEMLVEIEDSDSSSSEEEIEASIPPPPKLKRQNAEIKTNNKVECDICGKQFSKGGIRMHRISCEKKNKIVAEPVKPKSVKKDKKVKIAEPEPIEEEDQDDKPLTMKQMKAFMESQKEKQSIQVAEKPKRKYVKKPKQQEPTPPPTPQSVPQIPKMIWA